MAADLVLTNARVYAGASRGSIAEALAVLGERIVAVGTAAEIEATSGPGTRVVNLHGHTVIPGLNDAHLHLLSLGQSLRSVNLQSVTTIDEAVERVRKAAAQTIAGRWIAGAGRDRK